MAAGEDQEVKHEQEGMDMDGDEGMSNEKKSKSKQRMTRTNSQKRTQQRNAARLRAHEEELARRYEEREAEHRANMPE